MTHIHVPDPPKKPPEVDGARAAPNPDVVTFSEALEAMKGGTRVSCVNWAGEAWVELVPGCRAEASDGAVANYQPYFGALLVAGDGGRIYITGYVIDASDMLSDWYIVD